MKRAIVWNTQKEGRFYHISTWETTTKLPWPWRKHKQKNNVQSSTHLESRPFLKWNHVSLNIIAKRNLWYSITSIVNKHWCSVFMYWTLWCKGKKSGKITEINENSANNAQDQENSENIRQEHPRCDYRWPTTWWSLLLATLSGGRMFSFLISSLISLVFSFLLPAFIECLLFC